MFGGPTLKQHCLNTDYSHNAVSMLGHRLRRWANIETALSECAVFAGEDDMLRLGILMLMMLLLTSSHPQKMDGDPILF